MVKMPIVTFEWNVCTPTLFRYMDKKHVDSFFNDGSLRLSSFSQFKKHTDEQRLDKGEGKTMFVHVTQQGGGQTIEAWAKQGYNAYILSATMIHDKEVMKEFGCDSYIRINDSTNFGIEVSKQIQGMLAGHEGPCLYQDNKIIQKDLGYIDPNQFKDTKNLQDFVFSQLGHLGVFLKDKCFKKQVEYRFAWMINNIAQDYLDIKVPDARKFCEPPNSLTE